MCLCNEFECFSVDRLINLVEDRQRGVKKGGNGWALLNIYLTIGDP